MLHALWSVVKGVWFALDGLRKVLHLILLLALFGLLLAASQSELPFVPDKAALVLTPRGQLVEELSGDPLDRALARASGEFLGETRIRDLVDVVDEARDDDRIQALVLDLEKLEGAGLPMMQDLAQSIRWFRESGKKVYAYAQSYSQRQYYLAAQADEVYLDPMGFILIEGYGYYRTYYRGTLDKLAVDINVFRAGSHKSAPEVWTRTNMSPEDRADAEVRVGALWDAYKSDVGAARGLDPALIQAFADEAATGIRATGGDVAQYALARGLVDGLKTRQEFEELIAKVAGDDEETVYSAVDWDGYLPYVRSEESLRSGGDKTIAVVVASGEILDGRRGPGLVGGDSLARLLRDAKDDEDIAAVVLRIDSPGGSIMASEVIRREVAALKAAGKPVVASMSTVAASGGYYIAMNADRILAAPTTITGSIGVFAVIPTFQRTLDKIGIVSDGFGTTRLSGQTDLDRGLGPDAKEILQATVERHYRTFVEGVAAARKRRPEEIDSLAQGRVWTGADAKAAGIVDELGGIDEAIAAAAGLAGLEEGDYGVQWTEQERTWRDELALHLQGAAAWVVDATVPQRETLPYIGVTIERARALLALAAEGRPVYLCACRVE
ncbi:MAG TPA: signal peptide peptidase SppA [Steroidobacteraceae bacterium]|nr:signal peptide peptidase SppA [Steroidobacteraceae bacterium]